ncbi:MAG TPA: hypothetical protein DCR93_12995 [Cytophagales bacterium]|nr:hypothetical protein [Cytophagales bacterium]HAP60361.1 hypothetical protein [Cytophagales bacterium]
MVEQPLAPADSEALADLPTSWAGNYRTLDAELTVNEIGTEYVSLERTSPKTYLLSRFLYVEDGQLDTLGFHREEMTLVLQKDSLIQRLKELRDLEPGSLTIEQEDELGYLDGQEALGRLELQFALTPLGEGYQYLKQKVFQLNFEAQTIRFYAEDTTAPPGNFQLHRWDAKRWVFNLENPENEQGIVWIPYVLTYSGGQLVMTQVNDEELALWAEDKPEVTLTTTDTEVLVDAPLTLWKELMDTPLLWEPFFEWEKDSRWNHLLASEDENPATDSTGMSLNLLIILFVVLIGAMVLIRVLGKRR